MKKLILPLVLLSGFAFSSCGDQCTECVYTLNGVEIPAEFCGSKDEVKDFEAEVDRSAQAAGAAVGEMPSVVCIKK